MSIPTVSSAAPFVGRDTPVWLRGGAGVIQARVTEPAAAGLLAGRPLVAVVCHPHSLHGGSMDNKVVTTLVRGYRDLGVPVLRFNFRGVGASAGQFDNGGGESDDLLQVVDWVRECYPGAGLLLAGFSFGSAVAARASHALSGILQHLVLVAPPVERYPYDEHGRFCAPVTVVMGDQDELVDAAGVYRWVEGLRGGVELLRYPQMTHFFHGGLGPLRQDVMQAVAGSCGG